MGKDLKGKELGKGICQRKDGLYSTRCTQHGQSYGRYFKTADRTVEIAIQRKLLSDYIGMVEQAAVCADPELYSYILRAVTEGTTFVVLKSLYGIPCERDMFYDRRRKFYWVLSGVR